MKKLQELKSFIELEKDEMSQTNGGVFGYNFPVTSAGGFNMSLGSVYPAWVLAGKPDLPGEDKYKPRAHWWLP